MLKKFKVGCNMTEYLRVTVEAVSKEAALEKVYDMLNNDGTPEDADVFDREFDAVQAEEVTH